MTAQLYIEEKSQSDSYGKFLIEPLEENFAQIIGHSLRRTLLSSIRGSAVFAVQIEGVSHEFTQLPGILEDVVNIILNVKKLDILQFEDGTVELELIGEGPCLLRGSDISTFNKAEILNPEIEIAHLEEGSTLSMILYIRQNKGYVVAEENYQPDLPINVIYLDSHHSPIKRTNYRIDRPVSEGEPNSESLIFEIWSSGAIVPSNALAYASKILKDHMEIFEVIDVDENSYASEQGFIEIFALDENLQKSVSELELSVRSINCLQNAKIETIGDLVQKSEAEMLRTKNFGRKSLNEIKTILASMNLSLGMKLEDSSTSEKDDLEKEG